MLPSFSLWMFVALANEGVDPCPTSPPVGYRLEVGYGRGRYEAEALTSAREQARAALIRKACAEVGALRCASIKRHIHPWGAGQYDKKAQSACAAMAIKAEALSSWERDLEQLHADIGTLGHAISAKAAGLPIVLDDPRWPSGCVASDIGPSLSAKLRNHLAGVPLLTAGQLQAPVVRLTLAPGRDALTLSAAWTEPERPGETPLGGFGIPLDLFDVPLNEAGACRGFAALGLQASAQTGATGLRATLAIDTHDGEVCEGEDLAPQVHVSAPAKVAVLTVGKDGAAYFGWPPSLAEERHPLYTGDRITRVEGGNALVSETARLGAWVATRAPTHSGDETLLIVAVPSGTSLGKFEGKAGFCRIPTTFSADLIPAGAAVASATFSVTPAERASCAPLSDTDREQRLEALDAAPPCW